MEFLLTEIEKALEHKLYFIALQSSLALPDICAALQSKDGKATSTRYIAWYDTYAKESSPNAITGEECYRFRCSYLHQGSTQHSKSTYKRIIFLSPDSNIIGHNNIMKEALNINISFFAKI